MPSEIDLEIAERLVMNATSSVWPSPGEKVVCTRSALKQAFLEVLQEAHQIGFLAGQEVRFREGTRLGSTERPSWMDVRLDDNAAMARHQLHLRPIVVRSLRDAGYHCLGDLRWVPVQRLIDVYNVGRKTAKKIRA